MFCVRVGLVRVHTVCVVAVTASVTRTRSYHRACSHVLCTHPPSVGATLLLVTPYPVYSLFAVRIDYSLYCSHDTCIHAQVRFSWRFGLALFVTYSGTHTSLTRRHTCCLCMRIIPSRSYWSLIRSSVTRYTRSHMSLRIAH